MRFTHLKIGIRLGLSYFILLLLALIAGVIGIRSMGNINERVENMYTQEIVTIEALDDAKSAMYRIRGDTLEHVLAEREVSMAQLAGEIDQQQRRIGERLEQYRASRLSDEEEKLIGDFERSFQTYIGRVEKEILVFSTNGRKAEAEALARGAVVEEFRKAREAMNALMDYSLKRAERRYQHAKKEYQTALWEMSAIMGAMLVLGSLTGWFVTRSIVNPMHRLQTAMTAMREDGDLSRRTEVTGKDEIARTGEVFNALAEGFQLIIRTVHSSAEQVASAASELSASAAQVVQATHGQNEAATATAAAVEQMTVSIKQVADNAKDAEKISDHAKRLSAEGEGVVGDAAGEMRRIAELVQQSSGQIASLAQRSGQISGIVDVIREIAEQTNLLALNAAIEAARAGEQGRGFAVVADEVRNLAARARQSTAEISTLIDAIQQETIAVVDGMETASNQVSAGVTLADNAGRALVEINEGAGRTAQTTSEIAVAVKEQSAASDSIAQNIEKISQMVEETSAAVEQTAAAADHLERLASELQLAIGKFKV